MKRNCVLMTLLSGIAICLLANLTQAAESTHPANPINITKKTHVLAQQAPKLNPKVLQLALTAYKNARQDLDVDHQHILTVIDYQLKNSLKRLWVFNVKTNQLLYHTLVAQGKKTGIKYAKHFSNRPGTRESCIGLFLTGKTYHGNLGYSLRLKGLDKGFNNNAYKRDIVMHGAWYVNERLAHRYDRIGYSWGCQALSLKMYRKVINTVKDGTLIFAYYPDTKWLEHSVYL